MHFHFSNLNRTSKAIFAVALTACSMASQAQGALTAEAGTTLRDVFELAWTKQPDAQTLQIRREGAAAQRRAASSWVPEPAALEMSGMTDRFNRNQGTRELEIGVAVPLWLPGERRQSVELAQAEGVAIESRQQAAKLRFAGTVRDAWWTWQRARIDRDLANDQLKSARRLAADTARRVSAGDLARADQHQADGAVAAAESNWLEANASAASALRQIQAMTGGVTPAEDVEPARAEPLPMPGDTVEHGGLLDLQDQLAVAQRAASLAATQKRANPELTLATTRDRGGFGESYARTVTLGVRIPFGAGPRHDARMAKAQVDAFDAQVRLDLEIAQVKAGQDSASARVETSRARKSAAERRATLALETRGFFDRSFRLGETDLPTRLRIETEAAEAERQAARSRVDLAAAISAWRQSLGLLPQ